MVQPTASFYGAQSGEKKTSEIDSFYMLFFQQYFASKKQQNASTGPKLRN